MEVDTSKFRIIRGTEKSFGLRHKEVVLTFDDGPIAGNTPRILKTLKDHCVKATFFYVGRMAKAFPKTVRKVVAAGHTLGHHTHNHNALPKYSTAKVRSLISRGARTVEKIGYRGGSEKIRVPFFRYPYLSRSKRTDAVVRSQGMVVFGANIDALDWKRHSPKTIHNRIMKRLRRDGKGIILMHDIHRRTAKMLPMLLATLKREGYKVVHIVPGGSATPSTKPDPLPAIDETIVVASASRPAIEPKLRPVKSLPQNETLPRLADVKLAASEPLTPPTAQPKTVKLAGSPEPLTTPVEVASLDAAQLEGTRAVSAPAKKVSKRKKSSLRVVAGSVEKKAKPRKKLAKKSRKKRRTRAKGVILANGWKLRRSQWILR